MERSSYCHDRRRRQWKIFSEGMFDFRTCRADEDEELEQKRRGELVVYLYLMSSSSTSRPPISFFVGASFIDDYLEAAYARRMRAWFEITRNFLCASKRVSWRDQKWALDRM